MGLDVIVVLVADLVWGWSRDRRLKRKLNAANRRFRVEASRPTDGFVIDIDTTRRGNVETGAVELTYKYRAVVGDLVTTEIELVGRQLVYDDPGLAMLIGKTCAVRYLVSNPQESKLEMSPILKEEFMKR